MNASTFLFLEILLFCNIFSYFNFYRKYVKKKKYNLLRNNTRTKIFEDHMIILNSI